jgi:hypothetical protein
VLRELELGAHVDWYLGLYRLHDSEEDAGLEPLLAVVEIAIAAVKLIQRLVGSLLNDVALLDNENLISAANGREAVGDHERCPAVHEEVEACLDEGFGL